MGITNEIAPALAMVTRNLEEWLLPLGLELLPVREILIHPSSTRASRHGEAVAFQRLEFLGDSVLNAVVARFLYHRFADLGEGGLSATRSALVGRPNLATLARRLNLAEWIHAGRGHQQRDRVVDNDSILADAVEALIGAVAEQGGFRCAEQLIESWLNAMEIHPVHPCAHPKTAVKEWAEKHGIPYQFEKIGQTGPDHAPMFRCRLTLGHNAVLGWGSSVRLAENEAARLYLSQYAVEMEAALPVPAAASEPMSPSGGES